MRVTDMTTEELRAELAQLEESEATTVRRYALMQELDYRDLDRLAESPCLADRKAAAAGGYPF